MDRLQFAGKLCLTRLHNVIAGVSGTDESWPRVWMRNGWGIRITEVYPDGTARIESVRFTEPFAPGWVTEPSWETAPPGWNHPRGDRYSIPTGGVVVGSVTEASDFLESMYGLDRVQPLPK